MVDLKAFQEDTIEASLGMQEKVSKRCVLKSDLKSAQRLEV